MQLSMDFFQNVFTLNLFAQELCFRAISSCGKSVAV